MRKRRRFTPEFKAELVPEILSGARSPAEACREHALSPNRIGLWKTTFECDLYFELSNRATITLPETKRCGGVARPESSKGVPPRRIPS
jgi:transposase-like protein